MKTRRCVGLDLGQLQDFTALALLEWDGEEDEPVYHCRTLRRWNLGTSYPQITADLAGFLARSDVGPAVLVLDRTGVGVAVTESIHAELLRRAVPGGIVAVTITAGYETTQVGNGLWHVPKKELVSVLQVLLGRRRLQVAAALPEAPALLKELQNFRVKITAAANETFESWRTADHDDLVLALALASWAALRLDFARLPWERAPEPRRAW